MDDDRRLANNPFARAVAGRPDPDDDKASSPVMYVAFGLLSLVMVAIFVAALVLPPLFMHTLIVRGLRSGRPGMLVVGVLLALFYFAIVFAVGKRLMGRPKQPPADGA